MWHMLSLFTQRRSVNWYTELEICVSLVWLNVTPGEGFLAKASDTSYLPLRNTCKAKEELALAGCPLGSGCSQRHRHSLRTPNNATAATAEGHAWLMCTWMEGYPSLLLFSRPLRLKLKPLPFSINTLDQKKSVSFFVLLGGPLSVVMGLQIWQLGS